MESLRYFSGIISYVCSLQEKYSGGHQNSPKRENRFRFFFVTEFPGISGDLPGASELFQCTRTISLCARVPVGSENGAGASPNVFKTSQGLPGVSRSIKISVQINREKVPKTLTLQKCLYFGWRVLSRFHFCTIKLLRF